MIRNRINRIHDRQIQSQLRSHSHKVTLTHPDRMIFLPRPLHREVEAEVRAERELETPKVGYLVIQWKDHPDRSEPHWKHWYFRWIYTPFFQFSHWLGIPKAKQIRIETDEQGRTRKILSWFENGGIFDDEDKADLACVEKTDGYKPLWWNTQASRETAEIGGVVFPRAKKPRRWFNPRMRLILKDRKQEDNDRRMIADFIRRMHQVLDQ
jgi:hypothetical protein